MKNDNKTPPHSFTISSKLGRTFQSAYLEYTGSIWGAPSVQQVVFARADKPLATVGKLEGEDTALMKVKLVLVWFTVVKHLHIAALHSATEKHTHPWSQKHHAGKGFHLKLHTNLNPSNCPNCVSSLHNHYY